MGMELYIEHFTIETCPLHDRVSKVLITVYMYSSFLLSSPYPAEVL